MQPTSGEEKRGASQTAQWPKAGISYLEGSKGHRRSCLKISQNVGFQKCLSNSHIMLVTNNNLIKNENFLNLNREDWIVIMFRIQPNGFSET